MVLSTLSVDLSTIWTYISPDEPESLNLMLLLRFAIMELRLLTTAVTRFCVSSALKAISGWGEKPARLAQREHPPRVNLNREAVLGDPLVELWGK